MATVSLIFLLLLTACSSLTLKDCEELDWSKKGFEDGSSGESVKSVHSYQKQCGKFGKAVSKADYLRGHREGLGTYCTHRNGLSLGQSGSEFFEECASVSPEFKAGFDRGAFEHKREETRKNIRESLLSGEKECSSASDCKKNGWCVSNVCQHDQSACTADWDCAIERKCEEKFRYESSINERISVKVCED